MFMFTATVFQRLSLGL